MKTRPGIDLYRVSILNPLGLSGSLVDSAEMWALDLGTTNTLLARWDDRQERPVVLELRSISRAPERDDALEAPRVVPTAVHLLEELGVWARLGQWGPCARHLSLGKLAHIGRPAVELNETRLHKNYIPTFKQALSRSPLMPLARTGGRSYCGREVAQIFLRELLAEAEANTGFVALQELAEQESVPVSVRAAAITILTARYPWHRVQPTIVSALAANSEQLVTMAVFAVGATRAVALLDQVCKLAVDAEDGLAVEIAKTLQQLGNADAEPALIKLLSRTSDEVRVWTAEALKRVGTVRAVEPLLLAASGNASIDLKNTARSAVRAIQNRLGDIDTGGLSLVDSAAGASAGALSLATEDGGLSLSVREPMPGALHSAARGSEQAKA